MEGGDDDADGIRSFGSLFQVCGVLEPSPLKDSNTRTGPITYQRTVPLLGQSTKKSIKVIQDAYGTYARKKNADSNENIDVP